MARAMFSASMQATRHAPQAGLPLKVRNDRLIEEMEEFIADFERKNEENEAAKQDSELTTKHRPVVDDEIHD
jgi:hypothetical protein